MIMWIARNSDIVFDEAEVYKGSLQLFEEKPYCRTTEIETLKASTWQSRGKSVYLDEYWFPEITFENSPVEVEFKFK